MEQRLGPYVIRGELARGGMGVVYRAHDPRAGRDVAIKVVDGMDRDRLRRFGRELEALTRVRHPNIVGVLGAGEERGRPWIALELVEGTDLQALLDRQGPLAPKEAARVAQALALALDHVHQMGLVHRDVKPQNVLLERDGAPRLTDLGLARDLGGGQSRLTHTGGLLGTPGFWAPEQVSGQGEPVGPACDVYGLGATLYAALTGEPPIRECESLAEALVATANERPRAPSSLRPGIEPALDALCLRCLEKRPEDRYPSAGAVARELARYLVGRSRPGRRGAAWPRRLVVGGALAAAAVTLAVVVSRTASLDPGLDATTTATLTTTSPATPTGSSAAEEATALRARAAVLLGERDVDGALAALERAIALAPQDDRAIGMRALLRLQRGDLAGALADSERATALGPSVAEGHVTRAAALRQAGRPADARASLDRALALDPDVVLGLILRATLRREAGDARGALDDASHAVELAPRSPGAVLQRGLARDALGDTAGALDDLSQAIELAPSAEAHEARADLYRRKGELLASIVDLGAALRLTPRERSATLLRKRAEAHLGASTIDAALADAEAAVALAPDDDLALRARGAARFSKRDVRGALADLDRVVVLQEQAGRPTPEAYSMRGETRRRLGDPAGALADATRALELDPRDDQALLTRGTVLCAQGEQQRALADLDAALAASPGNPFALAARALLLADMGDLRRAEADVAASRSRTGTAMAIAARARGLYYARDYSVALAEARRAAELDFTCAAALTTIGLVLSVRHEDEAALLAFTQALELAPNDVLALAGRATVNIGRGRLDLVAADTDMALALSPTHATSLVSRAFLRLRAGEHAEAVAACDLALGHQPKLPAALAIRGQARLELGDRAGALADLRQALAQGHEQPDRLRAMIAELERGD